MVAVLYVDCDRFKEVNDSLGHEVGDRVLVEAALRLRRATRSWDMVARLGGDEFAVVLERLSDVSDADVIGDRLVAAFREVWRVGGLQVDVRASVGGVCTGGWEKPDRLLAAADALMYDVKRGGGDGRTVVVADEPRECRCYAWTSEPRPSCVLGLSSR
jgi:diguanylate cyclase (GGDEF)-like protein